MPKVNYFAIPAADSGSVAVCRQAGESWIIAGMTLKLEIPRDVEAGLVAQAQANGLSLEDYLKQVLKERSHSISHPAKTRSQIAGQRIRELRKGVILGDITIIIMNLSKKDVSEGIRP